MQAGLHLVEPEKEISAGGAADLRMQRHVLCEGVGIGTVLRSFPSTHTVFWPGWLVPPHPTVGPYCWENGWPGLFWGHCILAFHVGGCTQQYYPVSQASVAPRSEANRSTSRIKVKLCSVSVPKGGSQYGSSGAPLCTLRSSVGAIEHTHCPFA